MKISTFTKRLKSNLDKFKLKRTNPEEKIVASYCVDSKKAYSNTTYYYVRTAGGKKALYLYPGYKLVAGKSFLDNKQLDSLPKKTYKEVKELLEKEPTKSDFESLVRSYSNQKSRQFSGCIYDQGFSYLTSLYYGEDKRYLDAYNELYNAVKKECSNLGIKYETDPQKILSQKLETNYEEDEFKSGDVRICRSKESIDEYFKTNILAQTDSRILAKKVTSLSDLKSSFKMGYHGNFLMNSDDLISALTDSTLPNRKMILKNYMEFFISKDLAFGLVNYLEQLVSQANTMQYNMEQERYNSNSKFIEELEKINKHNPKTETFRYHATDSLEDAKRIMEEGFYLYSDDLNSTSFAEFDINEILAYSYGNGFEFFGDYIIILSVPNGENVVQQLSPQEQKMATIIPRRNALIGNKPEYKVDKKHVVGIIDKKHETVIPNPEYINKQKSK